MTSPALPTLHFYHRDGCHLCDDARAALQQVLEDRVRRGDPIARVREINLTRQPELEARYGTLIPVLRVDDQELALVTSYHTIAEFLDRVLGRLA
jgi:hypothetical protein